MPAKDGDKAGGTPGPATDAHGRVVVDPTELTMAALQREMGTIQRELEMRQETRQREHASLQEHVETLLHGNAAISDEKFRSVETTLNLVERQRVEQKKDTKDAVDAALQAAKEAVKEQTTASERAIAKSEAATNKQLEQLNVTFATAIKGVTDLLNDTKDRIAKVETLKQGGKDTISGIYAFAGFLVALLVIGGFLAAAGVFSRSPG